VLNNTIVAGNFANGGEANFQGPAPDVFGALTSGQGNFIGIGDSNLTGITNGTLGNHIGAVASPIDPLLGPLKNNGGPTQTEAPLTGSPVIDAGVNSVIPAGTMSDQRGLTRIVNGTVDIGAVEVQNQKQKQRHDEHRCRGFDFEAPKTMPSWHAVHATPWHASVHAAFATHRGRW
jgi:hypothetical protein